jgi:hypothetical protein
MMQEIHFREKQVCGCVAVWLCGCVAVWECGCVAVWLCGCVAVWLCGCVAVWLCGCVAVWRMHVHVHVHVRVRSVGPAAHDSSMEVARDWRQMDVAETDEEEQVLLGRFWQNLQLQARCDCLWIIFVVVFLFLFPN